MVKFCWKNVLFSIKTPVISDHFTRKPVFDWLLCRSVASRCVILSL